MLLILILLILSILLESTQDAFNYKSWLPNIFKWKYHSKWFHRVKILSIITSIITGILIGLNIGYLQDIKSIIFTYGQLAISYVLLRYALFNISWNLQTKHPYNYLGTSNDTDILTRLFSIFNIWPFKLFALCSACIDILKF